MVVPRMAQVETASLADSLLEAVSGMAIAQPRSQRGFATISDGSAVRTTEDQTIDLVAVADAAIYRAKAAGRNCHRWTEAMTYEREIRQSDAA